MYVYIHTHAHPPCVKKQHSSRKTLPSEDMEDYDEEKFRGHGCGCLWKYCITRRQSSSESQTQRALLQTPEEGEKSIGEKWLKKKGKENIIRRFRLMINKRKKKKRTHDQFHYDPQSYALNFDDGGESRGTDFAARLAAAPLE